MKPEDVIINETKNWIENVVIACNFCPFAAREFKRGSIHYVLPASGKLQDILQTLALEFKRLDEQPEIETTLIILPNSHKDFSAYLDLVDLCEDLLEKDGHEGIYQLASFHPNYLFADSSPNDPANFTNRSLYPMLHILREESVTRAIDSIEDPQSIPARNIDFANQKGFEFMERLRESCREQPSEW